MVSGTSATLAYEQALDGTGEPREPGDPIRAALTQRGLLDRSDFGFALLCAAFVAAFSLALWLLWNGYQPLDNTFFGSDPKRVWANLQSSLSDFHRTPFHPLFASFCAVFEGLLHHSGLSVFALLTAGSLLYGALLGGLTYVAARLWNVSRPWALASVAITCASGAFASWSAIIECHVWGGITCLICLIGARLLPPMGAARMLCSAVLFVIAASMVFTNILLWAFATCLTRPSDRFSIAGIMAIIKRNILPFLISLGLGLLLLYVMSLAQRAYFYPNTTLGEFLKFDHDYKYILQGRLKDTFQGLFAFGLFAPLSVPGIYLAEVAGTLAALGFLALGLRKASASVWIMLFYLAGVLCFHSIYDRREAFIPAPNYMPTLSVLLAIAGCHLLKRSYLRYGAALVVALAALFNHFEHMRLVRSIPADRKFLPAPAPIDLPLSMAPDSPAGARGRFQLARF